MIDRICKLLESDNAEVQCAAATVLGELRPRDDVVRKTLHQALQSANETVQLYALNALDKLGGEPSLAHFIPLLGAAPQLKRRAAEALLGHGEKAVKLLRDKLKGATPSVRRGILDVLGRTGGQETIDTLLESFLDADFEVSKQATNSLIEHVKQLPDKERITVSKKVLAFLKSPRGKKSDPATVGGIKVLGYLGLPDTVPVLLAYVGPKNAKPVRTHALTALAHVDVSAHAKAVGEKLVPLLEDEDFAEIGDRALKVLQKAEAPKDALDRLLKLLKSCPQPAVRLYAAKTIGGIGSAKAAEALVHGLYSQDQQTADAAATGLRANPGFAPALQKALAKEKDVQRAWKIANILRIHGKALPKPAVRQFQKKLAGLIGKADAGFQIYFEILRSADPDGLRDLLLKHGCALLKRRKFEDAETYLRLLDRDDLASDESLFALAVCRLCTLRKDLGQASRDRSHAVALFSRLARKEGFPLVKRLQKEAGVLTAEDLLYLGFCFAERAGAEREIGGQILKFVSKKYGSKAEGKAAKQKLQTQGLA